MALLSQQDRKRIEDTIASVEERTAGELVVACLGRSDDYVGPRMTFAALGALALATVAHLIWLDVDATWFLGMQVPAALLLFWAFGIPGLLRLMLPPGYRSQVVEMRAERMFLERGIFDTRDRSGVLILLSELEHRAVILGDKGVHERVKTDGWQDHVRHIGDGIRAGKPADGVCKVIEEVGEILARDFPVRPDDVNELPNTVIDEKR